MDLSFPGFDRESEITHLPSDLAVLMVGIAARQTGSQTAAIQASFGRLTDTTRLLAPLDGAFNGPMATALSRWKEG